jgi:hypothetical protein
MEYLALLTLQVAINSFSRLSTDISLQGSPLIHGPPENVREFYDRIPGSQAVEKGFYIYPCNTVLPDIAFYFGGVAFPITKNFSRGARYQGTHVCFGSIMANRRIDINRWTLGSTFMANYYTIFDYGTKRVGFATLAVA